MRWLQRRLVYAESFGRAAHLAGCSGDKMWFTQVCTRAFATTTDTKSSSAIVSALGRLRCRASEAHGHTSKLAADYPCDNTQRAKPEASRPARQTTRVYMCLGQPRQTPLL